MPAEDPKPTNPEIREQLRRMLSAKRFRNAQNQSDFLALVVNRALKGKKTPGRIVAKALWPDKFCKDESTDVRVTANSLRKKLAAYYEEEGCDDPVRVSLPAPPEDRSIRLAEGEAYTPIFTYHPFQAENFHLSLAQVMVSHDLEAAFALFQKVAKSAPNHAGALIAIAETWCHLMFWFSHCIDKEETFKASISIVELLDKVLLIAPKSWRAYAVLGFLLSEIDRMELAKKAFDTAISLSRGNTESYPAYIHFLTKIGDLRQGILLGERYLGSHLSDPNAYIVYADVYLLAAQHENARTILGAALQVHGPVGLAYHRLLMMAIWARRIDDAVELFDRMRVLLPPFAVEATAEWIKKTVETWPEDDKRAFQARGVMEHELAEKIAEVSARVRMSLKD